MPRAAVLLIEPDPTIRTVLEEHLTAGGFKVRAGDRIIERDLADASFDLVFLNASLTIAEQGATAKRFKAPVILFSPVPDPAMTTERVVAEIQAGVADYLSPPLDGIRLVSAAQRALRLNSLRTRIHRLESEVESLADRPDGMVGESSAIKTVRDRIAALAPFTTPVLVIGETGVGKELVARAIHKASGRNGEFIAISSPGLSEQLFESELFGHEPGAFTSARGRKEGLVEIAHNGTLFLDEIADLPPASQAHLLRFLDTGRFRRLGGLREITVDVRIIAATNRDLRAARPDGVPAFREDLFFRLDGATIRVPPLRERREDIPLLIAFFMRRFAERHHIPELMPPPAIMKSFMERDWPGNIRELRHAVEHFLMTGAIETRFTETHPALPLTGRYAELAAEHMARFDRVYFRNLIERHRHNVTSAAREAGLDRKTLTAKLKQFGLGRFAPETGN